MSYRVGLAQDQESAALMFDALIALRNHLFFVHVTLNCAAQCELYTLRNVVQD